MTPSARTARLLIDLQQGLDDPRWGERNRTGDLLAQLVPPAALP